MHVNISFHSFIMATNEQCTIVVEWVELINLHSLLSLSSVFVFTCNVPFNICPVCPLPIGIPMCPAPHLSSLISSISSLYSLFKFYSLLINSC